jgi:poly-gamma-glutamate capsule biosynthesis protein CapA/YwtB (metallophosphatase superfamily)
MRSSFAWLTSVVAIVLAGCADAPPRAPSSTAPSAPAVLTTDVEPPAERTPPEPAATRISIAAVGDIMLGTDYPKNILPDDDGVGFLAGVTPALTAADIAFGNLEGTLLDGGEPVKECKSPTTCYVFRTPTRYAQHLRAAGFDVMSLANNHAADFGEPGRESTMQALDAVGIRHSGREGDVASWMVGSRRVALIAFAPNIGAHALTDVPLARARVAELAAAHDIVIVSFHGGAEGEGAEVLPFTRETYVGEDRGDVVEFARGVVDAGADLVVGHGPHVVRAMELYRNRLIAYSLGNFATYYGISVADARGFAPILIANLDAEGAFVDGRIHSAIQLRPGGPQPDPQRQALALIRTLTAEAFPNGNLVIGADGAVTFLSPP